MEIRYLYCKYENLKGFIHKGKPLRFREINSLLKLENIDIKDDESKKIFFLNSKKITSININNIEMDLQSIRGDIQIFAYPRRCFILCLSNSGYKTELYKRFRADICIKNRY